MKMPSFVRALRRAVATFVFATLGALPTFQVLDVDVAVWKVAAASGVGALINLAYRWSESVIKEPEPVDIPGGDPALGDPDGDGGQMDVSQLLVVVILVLVLVFVATRLF